MECISHPGTAAAGSCQMCGRALCASCINRFSLPTCEACLLTHNAAVIRKMYIDLMITVAIFAATTLFLTYSNIPTSHVQDIINGVLMAGAYWGWQFLNRIPTPLILTNWVGFMLFLLLKLSLSTLVGVFVAPGQIFKRIKEIKEIRNLEKDIAAGRA